MRIRPKRLFDGTCSAGPSRTPAPTAETEECVRIGDDGRPASPSSVSALAGDRAETVSLRASFACNSPHWGNHRPAGSWTMPRSPPFSQSSSIKNEISKRKTPFVPDGENARVGQVGFCGSRQTSAGLLLFRRLCRIMPHEQEIFKHRYRETGKIAHNGGARPRPLRLGVSCRHRQGTADSPGRAYCSEKSYL